MPFAEQCSVFMVWVVQTRWLLGDGWQVIEGCGYVSGGPEVMVEDRMVMGTARGMP